MLRSGLLYALDWKLLGGNQFQYAAEAIDELGRLLGAWLKGTDRTAAAVAFRAERPVGTSARFICQPMEKSSELKQFGHHADCSPTLS